MFDLNLLPLHFIDDQEQLDFTGLMAFNAPRRAARNRTTDQLLIMLTPGVYALLGSAEQRKLVEGLAQKYFQSTGTVTAALRTLVETVNQALLTKNLRGPAATVQVPAAVAAGALHGGSLYLAHAGGMHTFVLTAGQVEHFNDPQPAGRSLGVSKAAPVRFFQAEVQPGTWLLFSSDPPSSWTESSLAGAPTLTLDQLTRRLRNQTPLSYTAGLIQIQTGEGKINVLHSPAALRTAPVQTEPVKVQPMKEAAPAAVEIPAPAAAGAPAVPAAPLSKPEPAPRPVERPEERPIERAVEHPAPRSQLPAKPRGTSGLRQSMVCLWQGGRRIRSGTGRAAKTLLRRLLPPPAPSSTARLSTGTMAFIAIAVPLVVVAVASTIYFERGKTGQFQQFFTQAQATAGQAQSQTDAGEQRQAWEKTLLWLDKAESYTVTAESTALRDQAQRALDGLDGIARLDFQPAIMGGLGSTVQVTQMVAGVNDLYLLDASQGRVIRGALTSRGYEVDTAFRCEPGRSGSLMIGKLVQIAAVPKGNEYKATVMAVDAEGNILYCIPGQPPLSAPLAPPETGWAAPAAMTYDSGALYFLDLQNNAIWAYPGEGSFVDQPYPVFKQDPPDMKDVVDLAVNSSDFYLLHRDGHLTLCTISYVDVTPTRCTDPAALTDPRTGSQAATFSGVQFSRIQFTQPPDPSIYLLDPPSGAIYHFSLRLNLQRQLRARSGADSGVPSTGATAFTIGSNHTAYLAFGNKVFYALIP